MNPVNCNNDDAGPQNQRKRPPTEKSDHQRTVSRSRRKPVPDPAAAAAAIIEEKSWTEEMHRQIVEAIMGEGLKKASPMVILDNMTLQNAALSNERVKSHLQKYRNNKDINKSEFFKEYHSWIQRALAVGATNESVSPWKIAEMVGSNDPHLLGGQVAAFLSFAVMAEEHTAAQPIKMQLPPDIPSKDFVGVSIPCPELTPQEINSPLGASIMRVIPLCNSLTQFLLQQREAAKQEKTTGLETREFQEVRAAVSRAASADPSVDSSMLEPLDIQAAEMQQAGLSNFKFPSFLLPRGDSKQRHRDDRVEPAGTTPAIDPYEPFAYSNESAFQPPSWNHVQSPHSNLRSNESAFQPPPLVLPPASHLCGGTLM
jgi:SHAQKYF class myb-like DNA-binding protein